MLAWFVPPVIIPILVVVAIAAAALLMTIVGKDDRLRWSPDLKRFDVRRALKWAP